MSKSNLLGAAAIGAFVGMAASKRGKRALHVFTGRPIAYRISVVDGVLRPAPGLHTRLEECLLVRTSLAADA